MRGRFALLLLLPMMAGCVASGHLPAEQASVSVFNPVAFFAGQTEGRGSLKVALSHPQPTLVQGTGTVASDGTTTLVQEVRRGD